MNYTKAILDQNSKLKKENAKLIYENIELKKQISELKALNIPVVVVPKGTLPYPHKHQLERIDQLNQTQTDLKHQLQILRHFANKLGLYDANDYLKEK